MLNSNQYLNRFFVSNLYSLALVFYEMVIREMTENAVRERNEQSPEEKELQDRVARLSKEMQEKIRDLPEDVKKAITDYVEATLLAADHDCLYLYEQGAKDCVALLKKLGVL